MPERVLALSQEVSTLAQQKVDQIRRVTTGTKILALNASIEAARAGNAGFSIVAREVGNISDKIDKLARDLHGDLGQKIGELQKLGHGLIANIRGTRLADLALNMIDVIDRNLYERSCDVRWWATDSAVVDCSAQPAQDTCDHASTRLGVILDSYTVYLDLWIASRDGVVLANGSPQRFAASGKNVSAEPWFRRALETRDGTEFVACDIAHNSILDAHVATYSAAIRENGQANGRILGVLGIFFDWQKQSQAVVDGIRLTADEQSRTRALILDSAGRIIAASGGTGLFEKCALETNGHSMGTYVDKAGNIVGFALTPGYETYKGLGWFGALIQKPAQKAPCTEK
jgi:hypothetical protein